MHHSHTRCCFFVFWCCFWHHITHSILCDFSSVCRQVKLAVAKSHKLYYAQTVSMRAVLNSTSLMHSVHGSYHCRHMIIIMFFYLFFSPNCLLVTQLALNTESHNFDNEIIVLAEHFFQSFSCICICIVRCFIRYQHISNGGGQCWLSTDWL